MSCYVSSRDNRFYGARESQYGQPAPVTKANEFRAIRVSFEEETEMPTRRDKTGTRTFQGTNAAVRKRVEFEIEAYLSSKGAGLPPLAFLVQAALGGEVRHFAGGTAALSQEGRRLTFAEAHAITAMQAIATTQEVRFVESAPDANSVILDAPLTGSPGQQITLLETWTYSPGKTLPSLTLYDYWSPSNGIHRLVRGGAINRFEVEVAGDYHTMRFSGNAAQMLDSASFESGQSGLPTYPVEPSGDSPAGEPVPGHLGQIWLGPTPNRFYTLTKARVAVDNQLDLRSREFGTLFPACVVAGERTAGAQFELYSRGTEAYRALYQAARTRTPIPLTLQLGERAGQMCAISFPHFVPEVPEFQDQEERQLWSFSMSRAQGYAEDEIHVAFA